MQLPIQTTPTYTLTIPSTKKEIKYRPFLVRDEKSLLLAEQSDDENVMQDTLKQIISSCTDNSIDVNSLATFDLDYIFAQMRSKSIGEVADMLFTCGACQEKNNVVKLSVDISKIEVTSSEGHTNKIHLFDDVGVVMKYPTVKMKQRIEQGFDDPDFSIDIIIDCIDLIYNTNEVFHAKEQPREDLKVFVEKLNKKQCDLIENFFKTMPKFQKLIEFQCPACKANNNMMLEGIQDFF